MKPVTASKIPPSNSSAKGRPGITRCSHSATKIITNPTTTSTTPSAVQRFTTGPQYLRVRGAIRVVSTGSNSKRGSSASGAKYALVVFSQFLSSRSGKSGL
jgi:hypothetical protein